MIDRIHAPNKVNGCTKYEQDILKIVGCRVVMRVGWMNGQTGGQAVQGRTIFSGLNGLRVKDIIPMNKYY